MSTIFSRLSRLKGCVKSSEAEDVWHESHEKECAEEREDFPRGGLLKDFLMDPATMFVQQFSALYLKNGESALGLCMLASPDLQAS